MGLVHHSDRGSQYASDEYINFIKNNHIQPSMSRKGNPYDNPIAERLFETVKDEGIYYFEYATYSELYVIVKAFIDDYNNAQLHSSLGYMPPNEFEASLEVAYDLISNFPNRLGSLLKRRRAKNQQ